MPRHPLLLGLGALGLVLSACGSRLPRPGDDRAARRSSPLADLTGAWGSVEQKTDRDCGERIERQEWQIRQRGTVLSGFGDRSVTWVSLDGKPIARGSSLRCTQSWRYLFGGEATADGGRVQIASIQQRPGSCPIEESRVTFCDVRRHNPTEIVLDCGRGPVLLAKRMDPPVPIEMVERAPGSITGVWTWHHRSIDSEGDTKIEIERWQLRQRVNLVEGFYDRTVHVRSGDGRIFRCNGALEYTSRARFEVRGVMSGQRIRIRELRYAATRDRCETGHRTLDEYEGVVRAEGDEILLSWGRGAQILFRRY
jgi:hypothetical protein